VPREHQSKKNAREFAGAAVAAAERKESAGRLTVAYVMSRFPKVSETFVFSEILAVERLGVRVELYPLLRERVDLVHPEAVPLVERARYLPFISAPILRSQLHFLRRRPSAYLGALAAVVRGTWPSVNFLVGGLAIFPKVAHAARLMTAAGVDHVHCHFANHPALAGFVIHRLAGIGYSFTAHGSDLHVDRHMLCEKVSEADFVVTISTYNRDLIVRDCGVRHVHKLNVIHCGVDTGLFRPARTNHDDDRLRILCVGTLHEVKGQRFLLEACRLLLDEGVDVECRLVGTGEDAAPLERRIAELDLVGRVVLEGSRTRPEIVRLLRRVDVLAASSVPTQRGKREGIPVVLMEAMASGVPVVASAVSGIPELVEDGVSGLLVPPGDAPALARALQRLHDDEALARRLSRGGREKVEREFDLDRSAAALVERFRAAALA
jgi:colanic acid/amylovoran biosynthesis glycosyltransferase